MAETTPEMNSSVSYTPGEDTKPEQLRLNLANDIVNKEREVQEESLLKDKNWSDAYRVVHELVNDGEPYGGDDETAAKDALGFMSEVNYNLSLGTVPFAVKLANVEMTDTQKIAVRYMMDTYDKKDITLDGAIRFGKEIATDPTSYIGAATFGWGMAAKTVAKTAARKTLMEATKLNIKNFATSAYGAAAFEGASYTAADDAAFQQIKMATGEQEEYSLGQTAMAAGIGAVVAPVAVKGLAIGGEQITKGGRFLKDELKEYSDRALSELESKKGSQFITGKQSIIEQPKVAKAIDKTTRDANFKKWFGDSHKFTRDNKGNPRVLYHGSPIDMESFRVGGDEMIYFTDSPKYAERYSVGQDKVGSIYPVFISAKKVFDTRNPKHKKIFMDKFYYKWGNGTPLSDNTGLPDWTDAVDFKEFFEENGLDFDGVMFDEMPDNVGSGMSIAVFKPNQIKSINNKGAFSKDGNILKGALTVPMIGLATAQEGENNETK